MTGLEHHPAWAGQLAAGLEAIGLDLAGDRRRALLDYLALLRKWNRAYNLTAIRDPEVMVRRQLLDSLTVLPLLAGERILDVGTGPGLPGIPLAVAAPRRRFTLLDSNGKKTRFVQQAVFTLGLDNVVVEHRRIEAFQPPLPFDTIVSRAFAPLPRMLELTGHLLADGGLLLAMKGSRPEAEMAELRRQGMTVEAVPLAVPGDDGERHAILCRR